LLANTETLILRLMTRRLQSILQTKLLANTETLILRLMTRRLQSILQTQIFALKIWWAGRD
jgi:hypothetical protein